MHEIKIYKTHTILSFDFNLLLLILHVTLNIGLYRYICYENHVITSTKNGVVHNNTSALAVTFG